MTPDGQPPMNNAKNSTAPARSAASWLLGGALDLVYPLHCIGCGTCLDADGRPDDCFCPDCLPKLPFVPGRRCPKCGHALAEHAPPHAQCPSCEGARLFFTSATAPFKYEGIAQELILRFKLGRETLLAGPLSKYLIAHLEATGLMPEVDGIVAVPLHWRRLLKRGYNQSHLLAEEVSLRFGRPVIRRCLRRVVGTPSQTAVSREQRIENMRGAFAIRIRRRAPNVLRGKTLLLIDDVLTTGATCSECSRVLIEGGGARAVYVATVARTMFT